jgi:aspartyl-tRNA synthetase
MAEELLSVSAPKQSHSVQKIHGQIMEHDVFGLMNKAIKTGNPPHAGIADS